MQPLCGDQAEPGTVENVEQLSHDLNPGDGGIDALSHGGREERQGR